MLLKDRKGREFELSIVGHEVPNVPDAHWDWLIVDIRMKDDRGERRKRDPCLTLEEARELAEWLDELVHVETNIGPGMPDLAEPNLQIDVLTTSPTEIALRASFIFASKDAPPVFDHVDLVIERHQLERAVSDFSRELERYSTRESEGT